MKPDTITGTLGEVYINGEPLKGWDLVIEDNFGIESPPEGINCRCSVNINKQIDVYSREFEYKDLYRVYNQEKYKRESLLYKILHRRNK
jgi:fibronectin type 3 domain-containing protein